MLLLPQALDHQKGFLSSCPLVAQISRDTFPEPIRSSHLEMFGLGRAELNVSGPTKTSFRCQFGSGQGHAVSSQNCPFNKRWLSRKQVRRENVTHQSRNAPAKPLKHRELLVEPDRVFVPHLRNKDMKSSLMFLESFWRVFYFILFFVFMLTVIGVCFNVTVIGGATVRFKE